MPTLAEIILPLPVKSDFHYRLTDLQATQVQPGMRVLVQFGRKKIYTGLVKALFPAAAGQDLGKLRFIEEILDEAPLLQPHHLRLFTWMANYYACTEGEVLRAALPLGLKPESATQIKPVPGLEWQDLPLDDKEYLLLEALTLHDQLSMKEVGQIWDVANPAPRLRTMQARGLIRLLQEVQDTYKPKFKKYLKLHPAYQSEAQLQAAFDSLSRAPNQENLLMQVVSAWFKDQPVPKTETLKQLGLNSSVVKALVEKGILEEEEVPIDRVEFTGYHPRLAEVDLTPEQQRALAEIRAAIGKTPPQPVLLHGVTGSGKTHLYVDLIRDVLAEGKQVLYLLPEITLTKQIIERIRTAFGGKVGIYHSRFNDQERVEIWQRVRKREFEVVVGVRSAIFLPFEDLGLIVVDEEHDHSFKQQDPAPRYHARDVAVYYGHQLGIPVVMGSATPSFESYTNALQQKYALVELLERAMDTQLPTIRVVDMRVQRKQGNIHGVFSRELEAAIGETLQRGEQVILFQNRRGYAPFLVCQTCGHVPQCINCDISLTYHKAKDHLRCHYCGYTAFQTQRCDNCGNFTLKQAGVGTERIAEAATERFPDYRIERMDLDTTRTKFGYQHLIQQFELGQIDVLVGTQMVSKGLDFENVTLVGVIDADQIIGFPDFRAYEHAFQLLTQVSGRAGRAQKRGRVLIQTHMPDNPVLLSLQQPFAPFFHSQLPDRNAHLYPPFGRLIRMEIRHPQREVIEAESRRMYSLLLPHFGQRLLGPDYALVARVRNQFRMHFLMKIPRNHSIAQTRKVLLDAIGTYYEQAPQKTLRVILDVDPV